MAHGVTGNIDVEGDCCKLNFENVIDLGVFSAYMIEIWRHSKLTHQLSLKTIHSDLHCAH